MFLSFLRAGCRLSNVKSKYYMEILNVHVYSYFFFLGIFLFVQPEQRRSLWNAKLFPVVHPFDVLEEDAGEDDILWLASTGVSDIPDQQKLNRFLDKSLLSLLFVFFFYNIVFLCRLHCVVFVVWCSTSILRSVKRVGRKKFAKHILIENLIGWKYDIFLVIG